jgi:hypothetical protein
MVSQRERLDAILSPARAIVRPLQFPTHADIPVFQPDEKSERTYYLWGTGRVSQRRPPKGILVVERIRAGNTIEATMKSKKRQELMYVQGY